MTKYHTEHIKLKFGYRSQNKNGWPLIRVTINDSVVDVFEANGTEWTRDSKLKLKKINSLKIWHFGKNYHVDHGPDKFFELQKAYINGVDLKHHIHRFQQHAFLPPWDKEIPVVNGLYLGHEGYLELRFSSPVNAWIQDLFGIQDTTIHGQQTTLECLENIKKHFGSLNP